nr:hypothetical protein [Methanoculleus horonobensis]
MGSVLHEPKGVEYHVLDGFAMGEVVMPHRVDRVDDHGNVQGVENSVNDPIMLEWGVGSLEDHSSEMFCRRDNIKDFLEGSKVLWFGVTLREVRTYER